MIITKDNLEKEILLSEKDVLLDFWAPWCGPCKRLSPLLDEIEREERERLVVGKVDVSEEEFLAEEFKVLAVPTLIKIVRGKEVKRITGIKSKEEILAFMN